jgi:hypothetical protein
MYNSTALSLGQLGSNFQTMITQMTLEPAAPKGLQQYQLLPSKENAMKKVILSTTLAAAAMIAGSAAAFAWDNGNDSHYKDLYELKQLHAAFHQAVSHAGINAATQAQHLAEVLAVWTDDGVLITGGVTYSGKGTPGTASCAVGSNTLCDLYANVAGAFKSGNDWVSLTPIFTETITVLDRDNADIYFQCIYFDATTDTLKSNVSFGLPGMPGTGRARKVHGRWLLSYGEVMSFLPPTLDVAY